MNKKKTYFNFWICPALIGICLLVFVGSLIKPDREFSAAENRVLAHFPALNTKDLFDGSAEKGIDTWFSDQFPGRQTDFHFNYLLRKMAGQRSINDVFLGHGSLLGQSSEINQQIVDGNVNAIKTFVSNTQLPVTFMMVPNAGTIQKGRLPAFAPMKSQNEIVGEVCKSLNNAVKIADVRSLFQSHANNYIYYRSDHHWTTSGAGLAWQVFAQANDIDDDISTWNTMQVSNSFTGTLAGKTGSIGIKDDIFIAVAPENPEYVVTWADGSKTTSIYNKEALNERDQYQLFLGKNQALVQIDTTVDNKKHLLLFKDSYANSMIQYMLPYYQSITIVDPRYFYENLDTLMKLYNINEAAFIYSADTFVSDGSMQTVLATAVSQE